MKWKYKGDNYESIKVVWETINQDLFRYIEVNYPTVAHRAKSYNTEPIWECALTYVPKWDKVYSILRFGYFGNGNHLKFCLEDIYTKRVCFTDAKNVELVIKLL